MVEKYTELSLIAKYAERIGVRPTIGIRAKLASRGSGRWKSSGGYRSKFGLSTTEMVRALEELKLWGMADCLQLLHFHLGSQITNIRQVKGAVNEAARLYAELWREGATGLQFLDVGGGLGVDYDGSQTDFESSVNYTLQEYANDVVYHAQNVCDEAGVPHPTIITESGRAIAAYHSALVFNVLGVSGLGEEEAPQELPGDPEQPLIDLQETFRSVNSRNLLEAYHDAQQALDSALNLFSLGYLPLQQRCIAENLFWAICRKVQKMARELDFFPEELEGSGRHAVRHLFLQFLAVPEHAGQLGDQAAVSRSCRFTGWARSRRGTRCWATSPAIRTARWIMFIDRRDVKRTLALHEYNGSDYYLGAFMVGAYQEILGDLHNLFGDTNAVHVRLSPTGEVMLDEVIKGDTVREVLDYVQFKTDSLIAGLRRSVEAAVREGRLGYEEAGRMLRFYEEGLHGYTYLEDAHEK